MAAPADANLGAGLTLAGLLSATWFGIPMEGLAIGTMFCIVGVMGRCAFDIQRTLQKGDPLKMSKIAGWAGAGLMGAPMGAIIVMTSLKLAFNAQPDGAIIVGMLALGFGGQEIVGWIWTFCLSRVNKLLGLNVPVVPPGNIGGPSDGH